MKGRAGRRGFENVGYTVFVGIKEHKLRDLIFGELQEFCGVSPLNIAIVHKAAILLNQAKDKRHTIALISKLLTPPLAPETLADSPLEVQQACIPSATS